MLANTSGTHCDAEVYPNRHGQKCPMRVSRVRFYYVNTLTILRKIAILAETGKMEGKLATLVRKSVLILAAKYKYKLYNLFFARLVSRICSIYVSIFRTQCNTISHIVSN